MRGRLGVTSCAAAAAVLTGALLLAACGSDKQGAGEGTTLPAIATTYTTPPTTEPTATTLPQYYEVKSGDTLTEIAVAYGIPVKAIMELNGLENADDVQAGQILELPSRDIVATALPATVPGQTAPTLPGETTSTTVP